MGQFRFLRWRQNLNSLVQHIHKLDEQLGIVRFEQDGRFFFHGPLAIDRRHHALRTFIRQGPTSAEMAIELLEVARLPIGAAAWVVGDYLVDDWIRAAIEEDTILPLARSEQLVGRRVQAPGELVQRFGMRPSLAAVEELKNKLAEHIRNQTGLEANRKATFG